MSFEDLLGGRILAWLGGLAIVVGVVFFLVIAVDRGWIGVEARVALAFAGSTILLAAGLFLYERRGQTEAAIAAVASALAALYASLTYATAVQEVIGQAAGLLVAGIVGGAGAAIAVRWKSQFVAALALAGRTRGTGPRRRRDDGIVPRVHDRRARRDGRSTPVATLGLARARRLSGQRAAARFWSWDRAISSCRSRCSRSTGVSSSSPAIGYELRVPVATLRVSSASVLLLNAALATALGWTSSTTVDRPRERRRGCSE